MPSTVTSYTKGLSNSDSLLCELELKMHVDKQQTKSDSSVDLKKKTLLSSNHLKHNFYMRAADVLVKACHSMKESFLPPSNDGQL